MITIDELRDFLNSKYGRELSPDEVIKILNGCGLLDLKEAIEKTKALQKEQSRENH